MRKFSERLCDFEKLVISKQDFQRLLNGLNVEIKNKTEDIDYAIICENEIIGIGNIKNNYLKLKTYLYQ